jgi:DNA-binding PadR family transcriptional regulator
MRKFVVPKFFDTKNVSEAILCILSEEWPLTMKGIYNRLRYKYSLDVTQQGTHKQLKKLVRQEILILNHHQKKYYFLNKKWLAELEAYARDLQEKMDKKPVNITEYYVY